MTNAESDAIMNVVGTWTVSAILVSLAVVALAGAAMFVRFVWRQR
jgi:hypothetical protein